ncbi:MAG TPA: MCP four helix bundle domain-containing protein, partial [Bdellovibrio sp.]
MKLVLLCSFFIAVIVAIGVKDYSSSHQITGMYSSLVNTTLPKQYHINKSYEYFLAIRMNLRNLGLPGVPAEEVTRIEQTVLEDLAKIAEEKKSYEALGFTAGQKDLYDKQAKAWDDFVAVGGRVLALHKGSAEDKQKMIDIFFGDCPKTAGAFKEATKKLLEFHD